jgi:hypothetical protein
MDIKTIITITIITILGMAFVGGGMYYLMKKAIEFNKEADRIELMIFNQEDRDKVFNDIKALSGMSFHRTTGDRVRTLAKMFEVRYNVKIIRG